VPPRLSLLGVEPPSLDGTSPLRNSASSDHLDAELLGFTSFEPGFSPATTKSSSSTTLETGPGARLLRELGGLLARERAETARQHDGRADQPAVTGGIAGRLVRPSRTPAPGAVDEGAVVLVRDHAWTLPGISGPNLDVVDLLLGRGGERVDRANTLARVCATVEPTWRDVQADEEPPDRPVLPSPRSLRRIAGSASP